MSISEMHSKKPDTNGNGMFVTDLITLWTLSLSLPTSTV